MKKFTKAMSLVVVFMVALLAPVFAGCARTYSVDMSITGGNGNGGWVFFKNYTSAYGVTPVTEGNKYEVYVAPSDGYYVSDIQIDGEDYSSTYDRSGVRLSLDISKNTNIEVTFERYSYTFHIHTAIYNSGNEIIGWEEYTSYPIHVKHDDVLDLDHLADEEGNAIVYALNSNRDQRTWIGPNQPEFHVKNGGYELYTLKTKAELDYILTPSHSFTISDATLYVVGEQPYGKIETLNDDSQYVDVTLDAYTIKEGESMVIRVTPNAGYKVSAIKIDGVDYQGSYDGTQMFSFSINSTSAGSKNYEIFFEAIS